MNDAEPSWQFLEMFVAAVVSAADFEQWFRTTPALESSLGARVHQELVAFDFRQNAPHDLLKLVRSIYESARPGRLARDRGFRIARGLLSGQVPAQDGVRVFSELCQDGHDWVPGVFVSMQAELDKIPRPEQYAECEPAV